jgi:hypothetical protein
MYSVSNRTIRVRTMNKRVTYNRQHTALSSDTSLAAGGVKLFEGLRCVGG